MPHITIEYSANLEDHHDVDALVERVHAAAIDHGLAAADALRTRAVARHHFRIADGHPSNAFVAIVARVGPGRDRPTRQAFIKQVLDAAESQVDGEGGPLAIAWSIEITELDAELRLNRNHVKARLHSEREDTH